VFQAVHHAELDKLCLVAIRDFLKKRTRYPRLVAQNNKADGVNFAPITVVASIDPELLENPTNMKEIDAESVDDCTDESVMEFLSPHKNVARLSQLLCGDKDETSVKFMSRMFCCNFLRKS
jgi:hypothetical protein